MADCTVNQQSCNFASNLTQGMAHQLQLAKATVNAQLPICSSRIRGLSGQEAFIAQARPRVRVTSCFCYRHLFTLSGVHLAKLCKFRSISLQKKGSSWSQPVPSSSWSKPCISFNIRVLIQQPDGIRHECKLTADRSKGAIGAGKLSQPNGQMIALAFVEVPS